jgi:WD40 repeat protein
LLDVSTGARIKSFNAGLSVDLSVCPTKNLVVSATALKYDGGLLRVWDTTNIFDESPLGHDQTILTVNFSPDGKSFATGSMYRTVKLWSIADRICTQTLEGHSERVENVSFSPDSKIIAIIGGL